MLASQFNAGFQHNSLAHGFVHHSLISLNPGLQEQYSENYCFVQNTYFLPLNHYIPQDIEQREEREIG